MLVRITCYDVYKESRKKETIWEIKAQEDSPNSRYGPVAGPCCKHDNKPSGEIKKLRNMKR
jgi:hypothetical protein